MQPTSASIQSVVDWLIDGARSAVLPQDVLTQLCERATAAGMSLYRAVVFIRTLHPQVVGRRFVWQQDKSTEVAEASFDLLERDVFRNSPMAQANLTSTMLRRRLADPDCTMDYPILHDLRKEGVTDYVISPLIFTKGETHFASWATKRPGGFTENEMTLIEQVSGPLARVAEIRASARVANTLLATYVGQNAGTRIMAGQIRRGSAETIHAAIWLSDMRGFTRLADSLPPQVLLDLLNRYFDCQVPAIAAHGGEVLKFMGDGLLVIFPISDVAKSAQVCTDALAAAHEAREKVAAMEAAEAGVAGVRFGLALHIGDVLYGNIGSGNRLDFTCIGPAVNLAARLEKLAGRLGRTILASQDFAHLAGEGLGPIGTFAVAGFAEEQTAFGLNDEKNKE